MDSVKDAAKAVSSRYLWTRGNDVINCISIFHLWQAVLLLLYGNVAINVTALLAVRGFMEWFRVPDGSLIVALVLFCSATAALIGAWVPVGQVRFFLFIPQHFFLIIMAFGGQLAAINQRYLDGTRMPWPHISADQAILVVAMLLHSSAIYKRCKDE